MAVLCGLPLLAWFVIPESPRWLIERQRAHRFLSILHIVHIKAEISMKILRTKALLEQIAKDNKKELPLPK